jgi:hypothetical protein
MTYNDIINVCKFYKGEAKCPYPKTTPEAILWEAEKNWINRAKEQYLLYGELEAMNNVRKAVHDTFLDSAELSHSQKLTLFAIRSWIVRRKYWDDSIVDVWLKA